MNCHVPQRDRKINRGTTRSKHTHTRTETKNRRPNDKLNHAGQPQRAPKHTTHVHRLHNTCATAQSRATLTNTPEHSLRPTKLEQRHPLLRRWIRHRPAGNGPDAREQFGVVAANSSCARKVSHAVHHMTATSDRVAQPRRRQRNVKYVELPASRGTHSHKNTNTNEHK